MIELIIVSGLIFLVAFAMTMVGKGGGNFYVVILAIVNTPMHQAATTGQFILFAASVAAMIVFQKNKAISWSLAAFIGGLTAISAFGGGYFSHLFSGFSLKFIFAGMLFIAGALMFVPLIERKSKDKNYLGILNFKQGKEIYRVNLWISTPLIVLAGFGSGMVGVSGGSFLVPLMVVACGVPMHRAIGTASILIATSAFMGFAGHAFQGDFNPFQAIPLAMVAILGGLLGGKFALKTKPQYLKMIFAYTNWLAALFIIINAIYSKWTI
jgi:uncharacterized membrane protein YfcA